VSQRVNPAPSPADASTALASTKALHPELANRKDIPLTAFDFLDGAYAATKRARAVGTGLLAVSLIVLAWTVVSGLVASGDVDAVRAEVTGVEESRARLVTDFVGGESVEGIPTESLLARERALAVGFAGVTNRQGDFPGLLAELRSLGVPGARVTGVSYGLAASSEKGPSAEEADEEVTVETVSVLVLITGENLASTVALADRVKQTPGLSDFVVDLAGTGAAVTAKITLDSPPDRLLSRLSALGIRADAQVRAEVADAQAGAQTGAQAGGAPVPSTVPAGEGS